MLVSHYIRQQGWGLSRGPACSIAPVPDPVPAPVPDPVPAPVPDPVPRAAITGNSFTAHKSEGGIKKGVPGVFLAAAQNKTIWAINTSPMITATNQQD